MARRLVPFVRVSIDQKGRRALKLMRDIQLMSGVYTASSQAAGGFKPAPEGDSIAFARGIATAIGLVAAVRFEAIFKKTTLVGRVLAFGIAWGVVAPAVEAEALDAMF